jgi:Zn-dependent protease
MFEHRWRLFRLFGFEVSIDPSWFLIAVLVAWSLAEGYFPSALPERGKGVYWLMGVVGAVGLFVSIVFHEFCHSIVARHYGMPMKGITLFLFGGVAQMEEEPKSPKAEMLMAAAGPAASIVLGAIFIFLFYLTRNQGEAIPEMFLFLAVINWILAVFNLLPAFPLDGGRILRSLLWWTKNDRSWATSKASAIGVGFGWILVILGVLHLLKGNFLGGVWYALIGMFLAAAARSQAARQQARNQFLGRKVSDLMTDDPVSLPADATIRRVLEDHLLKQDFKFYPVMQDGRLVGCVSTRTIKETPTEQWDATTVMNKAQACRASNAVSPDASAAEALKTMQDNGLRRLLVVRNDELAGVVTLRDILGEKTWIETMEGVAD